jgi:hypothetical protein
VLALCNTTDLCSSVLWLWAPTSCELSYLAICHCSPQQPRPFLSAAIRLYAFVDSHMSPSFEPLFFFQVLLLPWGSTTLTSWFVEIHGMVVLTGMWACSVSPTWQTNCLCCIQKPKSISTSTLTAPVYTVTGQASPLSRPHLWCNRFMG